MTDNDNLLIEKFFNQAARQQIEDNGFTERVMEQIVRQEQQSSVKTHHLSLLWTWFCVVVGLALFVVLGGWGSLKASIMVLASTVLTSLEVFVTTAPTVDLHLNPALLLLVAAFVLIYLPYRTARMLSAIQ